jgi:hypothetical protein
MDLSSKKLLAIRGRPVYNEMYLRSDMKIV